MTIATSLPIDPLLDQAPGQGQFTCSYRFLVYDFPTKTIVGEVYPDRDSIPTLSHDSERTITREISGLVFTPEDSALLDIIRHRIQVQMIIPGRAPYALGTFMFMDDEGLLSTAGTSSDVTMVDEMFIVDQQIEQTYAAGTFEPDGTVVTFRQADDAIRDNLQGLPVTVQLEPTPFYSIGVWSAGSSRGSSVVKDLAVDGDYFSPWFSSANIMTFIRAFDPASKIPAFNYDYGYAVNRDSISFTNDLIQAPNRFVVISNGSVSDGVLPVVGTYDIPSSAPHSIANRGFVIPEIIDWQVDYASQANAIAANLGQRQTIYERVEFTTSPDPRHESYDVFHFNGVNWLEIYWELPLSPAGKMRHIGRKVYS